MIENRHFTKKLGSQFHPYGLPNEFEILGVKTDRLRDFFNKY